MTQQIHESVMGYLMEHKTSPAPKLRILKQSKIYGVFDQHSTVQGADTEFASLVLPSFYAFVSYLADIACTGLLGSFLQCVLHIYSCYDGSHKSHCPQRSSLDLYNTCCECHLDSSTKFGFDTNADLGVHGRGVL